MYSSYNVLYYTKIYIRFERQHINTDILYYFDILFEGRAKTIVKIEIIIIMFIRVLVCGILYCHVYYIILYRSNIPKNRTMNIKLKKKKPSIRHEMLLDCYNNAYNNTRNEIKLLRNCADYKILNDATFAIIVKVNDQSTSYRFDLPELYV